jgi:serine/threonine-protein kinase
MMGRPEPSPSTPAAGDLLGGKYRLESELGRGAMGAVWLATHTTLGQKVAVKVIAPEHADSDELRQRFEREARAAARLRSRYVVSVYDHGETDAGLPYIVMEYLQGECLEDRINRFGALPLGDVARITRHVGRALAKAHAAGIVHRDLKPANIYLASADDDGDEDWFAKVLDFGIAKVDDFSDRSTTKTGTVLGTPLFMSPEQVRGASQVDARADLYSLGMVVYNMLTGTFAFEGQSFGDLLVSICTDPLPRLSERAPHVPPALDDWFAKACARDASERYPNADELVRGFTNAVGDEESLLRQSSAELNLTTLKLGSPQLAETFAVESGAREIEPAARKRSGEVPRSEPTIALGTPPAAAESRAPGKPRRGALAVLALLGLAGAVGALILGLRAPAPPDAAAASGTTSASPTSSATAGDSADSAPDAALRAADPSEPEPGAMQAPSAAATTASVPTAELAPATTQRPAPKSPAATPSTSAAEPSTSASSSSAAQSAAVAPSSSSAAPQPGPVRPPRPAPPSAEPDVGF